MASWRTEFRLLPLAVPALLLLGAVMVYPLLHLLALGADGGTFLPYRKALGGSLYLAVLGITLAMALATTAISLILAYPVAYFLATAGRVGTMIGFVFLLLPFWTSLLVRTYAWMALLGRNGVINRTLLALGIVGEPLPLLYNFGGVLVGIVHVLLPYMVFPIYAAMLRVDRNLVLAAEGLGAPPLAIFWRIYLPLTAKGVFAGMALVFVLALGAFVTPALLGGGKVPMIANLIQQEVSQFLDWPFASALAAILLCAALVLYGAMRRVAVAAPGAPQ